MKSIFKSILCYSLILIGFLGAVFYIQDKLDIQQTTFIEQATKKAALQCYALEGFYPPDLSYLEVHYGLRINKERYDIYYDAFSNHIMPDIQIILKE